MSNKHVNPVFHSILDSFSGHSENDVLSDVFTLGSVAKEGSDILLDGYRELMEILDKPGEVNRRELLQSIGKTLKKFSA